jgi:hypothetical protein
MRTFSLFGLIIFQVVNGSFTITQCRCNLDGSDTRYTSLINRSTISLISRDHDPSETAELFLLARGELQVYSAGATGIALRDMNAESLMIVIGNGDAGSVTTTFDGDDVLFVAALQLPNQSRWDRPPLGQYLRLCIDVVESADSEEQIEKIINCLLYHDIGLAVVAGIIEYR